MSFNLNKLTYKQKKIYSIIEAFIKANDIPPSVREICKLAEVKSPGSIQGILNRLEQKGAIKRQQGMARSIKLTSEESILYNPSVYIPQIKRINDRNIQDLLTIYNIERYLPIPQDFIAENKQYLLMSCPDNIYILLNNKANYNNESITKNDLLLICTDCEINLDDKVVLFIEGFVFISVYEENEADNSIIITADTPLLDRRIYSKDEVNIIGKLTYCFKKY